VHLIAIPAESSQLQQEKSSALLPNPMRCRERHLQSFRDVSVTSHDVPLSDWFHRQWTGSKRELTEVHGKG
jgi:hypothetical protein